MESDKSKVVQDWYDTYNEPIFKFIFMMIQDYQQAEDLRHETFIKAFVNYDSFKHHSSPKTWLYSIAHNVTVDFIRKRKPLTMIKEVLLLKKDEAPMPCELVQIRETSIELYRVLGTLKESYRKVIILRKVKGFSIYETAMILGWSESKVKSTLFRAIQAFEKEMLKEGLLNEKTV
ncbi:RNA polymerase sigma factor [Robertmurraya sp. P23]|uniref:RNA polymerase sigma factor n=1 Tax=Robertmurraya sp. P23 TaxID=3436931 RepID=UPI003D99F93E